MSIRRRFRVSGIVQGVGFRPFVYTTAERLGLAGTVWNDSEGVGVEVEGPSADIDRFETALRDEAPPLAVVDEISGLDISPTGEVGFRIASSEAGSQRRTLISPDVCPCADCFAEIADPGERRHRYAFTNCTNCGPRFTITRDIPYDRANTTMAAFEMCDECAAEYHDPSDRRFHAQPVACPKCGPRMHLDPDVTDTDAISAAAELLIAGQILAIKGLGGFHLACVASMEDSVAALRARKHREEKPFAVMVGDIEDAERLCSISPAEAELLSSIRRPIVLLTRLESAPVAPSVAPGNRSLGVMLPSTPLHRVLLDSVGEALVMTSGNVSDEPIVFDNDEARQRLSGIADAFLMHDRDIHIRCDDSVVRVWDDRPYPIRRARGYAPEPVRLTRSLPVPVLAVGAELKHTFCVGKEHHAFVSHHIGDLENWETMRSFVEGVEHFTRIFDVTPEAVAHDLHPEYLSTKWALEQVAGEGVSLPGVELEGLVTVGVQHHHAHVASCLADSGETGPVIGVALDGTGFGDDGSLWGFEILRADLATFERVVHLAEVPLPGGSRAIREPWRMAAVYLDRAFGDDAADLGLEFVRRTGHRWGPIFQLVRTATNAPNASSAGRLFDAVAAICGLRDEVSYEGQAAIELEQAADPSETGSYPCPIVDGVLDGTEIVHAVTNDLLSGTPVASVAARFHNAIADAVVRSCVLVRSDCRLTTVALSGGTFQNVLLLDRTAAGLVAHEFRVLVHRRVPANDGGIALGQAAVAGARLQR